jgi:hypothetical protein
MLNVAKKILAKREQQNEQQDVNSSVRAMKEKFENMINNVNEQSVLNEEVHLTPRLLIKKFEAMSKDGAIPQTQSSASKPIEIKKTATRVVSSFLSNIDTAIQSSPQCNSTKIIDCSSKSNIKSAPKYDIEFIDSTDTTQITQTESDNEVDTDEDEEEEEEEEEDNDDDDDELSDEEEEDDDNSDYEVEETYIQDKTLTPKVMVEKSLKKKNRESEETGKFSLTFVSSITNQSNEQQSKPEVVYENLNRESEPLYEELNNSMTTNHSSNIDEIYMKKQEIIKNFKIDYEDDEEEEDDDFERNSQNTSKFTTASSTAVSRAVSADTISSYDSTYSISSIGSESSSLINQDLTKEQTDQLGGIYSIKDYRRQKKTGVKTSARRSLLQQQTTASNDGVELKKKLNLIEVSNSAASSLTSNNSINGRIKVNFFLNY